MWKTFTVGSDVYLFKLVNNNDTYSVSVSDLKDIWSKDCLKHDIVETFKESNPVVVVEAEEAVTQALKILNEINSASVTVDSEDDEINLIIKSETLGLSDTKFKLKYQLKLSKNDKFVEEVTVPMIHTINYLEKQQEMLCNLIKKKDRELEEYKMEKGNISRTDLVTEAFDPSVLRIPNEKLMLNTYNEGHNFWQNFISKYGDIEANVMEVKIDPWNQVKRKRKTYNAKTSAKKFTTGISYKKE